ncbi:hypothetical protein JG676_05135, partial [Campylobacter sp. 2018MI35]|nr:hypothetical protein [Campylobacter sp. 2018MI34]
MISSDNGSGVYVGSSTIENFTNKGTIKTSGTAEPNQSYAALYASNGVNLFSSTIGTFENSVTISGKVGVNLSASSIENFKNTGTIEGTSSSNNLAGAINIQSAWSTGSTISNFENSGFVKSSSNGIFIGDGSAIKTLTNKGTIDAKLNGISFYGFHTNKKPVDIGKITIESNGVIKAGNNGINIDGSEWGITGEGIDVKGRLEGGNAGIYIGAGKQVNTSITVSGTIQGNNGGIINTGTIGQKDVDVQTHGITIENGGTITSKNGSGILNTDNGIIYG